jgi:hypothetical protein
MSFINIVIQLLYMQFIFWLLYFELRVFCIFSSISKQILECHLRIDQEYILFIFLHIP